jgi:hypothetical protein
VTAVLFACLRWHLDKTSLAHIQAFTVTGMEPGCVLRIEVLDRSNSPDNGHKVSRGFVPFDMCRLMDNTNGKRRWIAPSKTSDSS